MLDMDEGARKWLYKTCHKNFWRVIRSDYEFDDMVQDGLMKFYHVRMRYPQVKDPPHLMALFKIAFLNHIHGLASRRTKSAEVCFLADMNIDFRRNNSGGAVSSGDAEITAAELLLPPEQSCGPLFAAILNAPKPLLRFLEKVASDPALLAGVCRRRRDGTRQTLNERLCRLVKLDPKTIDLPGMLKDMLAG